MPTSPLLLSIREEFYTSSINSLFDRRSDTRQTKSITSLISSPSFLVSTSRSLRLVPLNQTKNTPTQLSNNTICEISNNDSHIFLQFKPKQNAYISIGEMNRKCKYRLNMNDIIKIGNTLLKVKEISLGSSLFSDNNSVNITKGFSFSKDDTILILKKNSNTNISSSTISTNKACRICLCDDNNEDNPLLSPCGCKGTMKFIHYKCLQRFIFTKNRNDIEVKSKVVSYKPVHCDLCGKEFPLKIKISINNIEMIYDIIKVDKPLTNYITLEIVKVPKGNVFDKEGTVFFLDFNKTSSISIGRAPEEDVSINDHSASRHHCIIDIGIDGFYLQDEESKFGTYVNASSVIPVIRSFPLYLQIGNYCYVFKAKRDINFMSLLCEYCFCAKAQKKTNEVRNYNDYYKKYGKNETIKHNDTSALSMMSVSMNRELISTGLPLMSGKNNRTTNANQLINCIQNKM